MLSVPDALSANAAGTRWISECLLVQVGCWHVSRRVKSVALAVQRDLLLALSTISIIRCLE